MKYLFALVLAASLAVPAQAVAGEDTWEGPWSYYGQRTDSVTEGAGNAKEVNSAIQALDPWPPYAANRDIPSSGERMSRAIRRYHDVTKLLEAAHTPTADLGVSGNSGSGSSNGK